MIDYHAVGLAVYLILLFGLVIRLIYLWGSFCAVEIQNETIGFMVAITPLVVSVFIILYHSSNALLN